MRAGACAVLHQTLSPEAASVLNHSLLLARRRGHPHLTPLHVAAALLITSSSPPSPLAAALRRASPPLQCRALHLCFNVALNRLPAACGHPILHAPPPSLSNALIAALKRAQAHQRRSGCAENENQQQQQNCLVPIRVDLDQLILSILDDPSVSRVMREAGFNSAAVKTHLEDCKKLLNPFSSALRRYNNPLFPQQNPSTVIFPPRKDTPLTACMSGVYDVVLGKSEKKNIIFVGENSSAAEELGSSVIYKLERGDADLPEGLKPVQSIKLRLSAVQVRFMNKHEVDMNVADLRRKLERFGSSNGWVIVYVGDLKWAVEGGDDDDDNGVDGECKLYNPVDDLVAEIAKLVCWCNNGCGERVLLMCSASEESYMKWEMKEKCLGVGWDLQAVYGPCSDDRFKGLSLRAATCGWDSRTKSKSYLRRDEEKDNVVLTCCPQCKSNFEKEAISAQLPYWLKPHDKVDLLQLRRKYNKLCQTLHSSISAISNPGNCQSSSHHPYWPDKNDAVADSKSHQSMEPNLDSLKDKEVKITLSLWNSADENVAVDADLRDVIRENVPWQVETIPLIVDALKDCSEKMSENKFLLIQGNDIVGKRRLAVGIAKAVFGSSDRLFCMNMRYNANYTASENREILKMALRDRERMVVYVEDVNCADPEFVRFLVDGKMGSRSIFILTTDGDTSYNVMRDHVNSVIRMKLVLVREPKHGLRMPNLDRKRKPPDWDSPIRVKNQRNYNEMEEVSSNGLDLNIKVDDDDHKQRNFSPISSDLTREITIERPNSLIFLKKIKNRYIFNMNSNQSEQAREMFSSMIRRSFHEATTYISCLDVETSALEKVLQRSGFYLNGLFEKWLKDVFRTSLRMVDVGDNREKVVSVRLCLDGIGESCLEDGFMGTCLPKRIPFSFSS